MQHDPLCRQHYQPYEDDSKCRDCELIKLAHVRGFKRGWDSAHEFWENN